MNSRFSGNELDSCAPAAKHFPVQYVFDIAVEKFTHLTIMQFPAEGNVNEILIL
jgi:hypothetical protein